ncbi:hypothetical protein SESBI_27289 [Sesbania bispinosa]|nr:hypothetical protein SESBI_27289 [Sesbania bispinosa]
MSYAQVGVGYTMDAVEAAEAYFQSTTFALSEQAHLRGESVAQGSSRHCFGMCTAGCVDPFFF